MPTIDDIRTFLGEETGLATVSTTQADGRVLSSVVNCAVIDHPITGQPCVALVSRGSAARLRHIRRGAQVTVSVRRGWAWVSATGPAELIGPHDPDPSVDVEALRVLLRDIFHAAGGTHDDLDEYDQAMVADGRTAVLISVDRVLGVIPTAAA